LGKTPGEGQQAASVPALNEREHKYQRPAFGFDKENMKSGKIGSLFSAFLIQ
jgi:hypothetical protein